MLEQARGNLLPKSRLSWLGPVIVGAAFVMVSAFTWRRWPDVLVDFGMQLYLPWKISQGSVLYQDIKYLPGGPFSQYLNALWFKLFGVSLLTLVVANLLIAVGLIALIYQKFRAASDTLTATLICLAVVCVFAFGQYSDIGNYNYVTPYCHEVWHGLVLSTLALALLSSWVSKEKIGFAAGAGFCGGLVFMTKPDVFIALSAGSGAAFVWLNFTKRKTAFLLKSIVAFLLAGAVPLLAFLFYFQRTEGWKDSLRSVCFAWVPLMESHVSETPFYKWCTGMDAPWLNVRAMLIHFSVVCLFTVITAFIFRRDFMKSVNRLLAAGWIALMVALASGFNWVECGRSLPLLMVVLLLMLVLKYRRCFLDGATICSTGLVPSPHDAQMGGEATTNGVEHFKDAPLPSPLLARASRREGEDGRSAPMTKVDQPGRMSIFPLLWSVFGLVLLAKLGLYCRIWHYGFVLAMPAATGAIYLLVWVLPEWLANHGVNRAWFRNAVVLILLTGMARLFVQSQFVLHQKTVAVGGGADIMFAPNDKTSPAAADVQSALTWLEQNTSPNSTLAVLPEGAMINYLARRTNPTHYPVWIPIELMVFGQDEMTRDFEDHPPDYVMLVQRDASEYGAKYFGREENYGGNLMRWINQHYQPVKLIGSEPFVNSSFGIKILRRDPGAQ